MNWAIISETIVWLAGLQERACGCVCVCVCVCVVWSGRCSFVKRYDYGEGSSGFQFARHSLQRITSEPHRKPVTTKETTIGDKKMTYLTSLPDEFFWVIACALCLPKGHFRGIAIKSHSKITLPKSFAN